MLDGLFLTYKSEQTFDIFFYSSQEKYPFNLLLGSLSCLK